MKNRHTTITPLKLRKLTIRDLLVLFPKKAKILKGELMRVGFAEEQASYLARAAAILFLSLNKSCNSLQTPKDILLKLTLPQINSLLRQYETLEDNKNG